MWKTLFFSNLLDSRNTRVIINSMQSLLFFSLFLISVGFVSVAPAATAPMMSADQKVKSAKDLESQKEFEKELARVRQATNSSPVARPRSGGALVSEADLFSEVLDAYELSEKIRFETRAHELVARFPNGIYADDTCYLLGMFFVSEKKFGLALQEFNKVITQYPSGNRLPAAMFAKASVYRRMELASKANKIYSQVIKQFPGSTESYRAATELQTAKAGIK